MGRHRRAWLGRINKPVWGRSDGDYAYLIYATIVEAGSAGNAIGRVIEIRVTKEQAASIAKRFSEWQREPTKVGANVGNIS